MDTTKNPGMPRYAYHSRLPALGDWAVTREDESGMVCVAVFADEEDARRHVEKLQAEAEKAAGRTP